MSYERVPPKEIEQEFDGLYKKWQTDCLRKVEKRIITWDEYLEKYASPQAKKYMQEADEVYEEAERQGVYI